MNDTVQKLMGMVDSLCHACETYVDPTRKRQALHDELTRLLDRLEAAETEVLEQARLLGIGGEKELALMAKLEAAEKDAARLDWLLTYFVSDDTSKDDEIIAASDIGVDQVKSVIDTAMKEQK